MNERLSLKSIILIIIIIMILPISFGDLTGFAVSVSNNVSLSIGNSAPVIVFVNSTLSSWSLNAGPAATTNVEVYFEASDPNGFADLNDSSALVVLNLSGEANRTGACVRLSNMTVNKANYSCNVSMKFYDGTGSWSINASISDNSCANASNSSAHVFINSNMNIILNPLMLMWTNVIPGTGNKTATAPINISNVGNININNISIKAYDLVGQGFTLTASNFSASSQSVTACMLDLLSNDTQITNTNTGLGTSTNLTNDSSVGNTAWTNITNASTNDGKYAYATPSGSNITNYLKAQNLNFNIPTTNTNITGIEIIIEHKRDAVGETAYTTAGTFTWTAPSNVTKVNIVAVGGGGGRGGGGGGLGYKNNISVTPGTNYTVVVGQGSFVEDSYFISTGTVKGGGGSNNNGVGGTYTGDGGGNGGHGGPNILYYGGGGGAGGYSGSGGDGTGSSSGGASGSGGGGGGGTGFDNGVDTAYCGGGGGVGIYGQGSNGAGAAAGTGGGKGGSGGVNGIDGVPNNGGNGGLYGGGGGDGSGLQGAGANGAVRIIWGSNRAFPSTNAGNITGDVKDSRISIVKSNGTIGSTNKVNSTSWSVSDENFTYGSSTDLWGENWTASDINSGNFGVSISVNASYATAYIDYVTIKVYYNVTTYFESNSSAKQLINNTDVNIPGAQMQKTTYVTETLNNQSINYCIPQVPAYMPAGTYTQTQTWVTTAIG